MTDLPHRIKVERHVVDAVQDAAGDFAGDVEVAQVGAREVPAGVAAAVRVRGQVVFSEAGVLDVHGPHPREELAVAGVAGRHDAVEHVDAAPHGLDDVGRRADAHQVPRLPERQGRGHALHDFVHHLVRFAHAEAADGVAREVERHELARAFEPQIREHAALHDAELRLAGIGRRETVDGGAVPQRVEPRPAARRPAGGERQRGGDGLLGRRMRRALVEHHRDVGAEQRLDVDGCLGRQAAGAAVEVRAERHAVRIDGAPIGQAEHLETATVGEDGARPAVEAVQSTAAGDEGRARPQPEVIRVAENHLCARVRELRRREGLHRALRTDGHERRCLDRPVRRRHEPGAGRAIGGADLEGKAGARKSGLGARRRWCHHRGAGM